MDGIIIRQPIPPLRPSAFKSTAVQAKSARSDNGGSVPASHTLCWYLRLRNQFTSRGFGQALPRTQVA